MGDLTKWEAKSTKINLITPIIVIVGALLLVGVAAFIRPKPTETKKKDSDKGAAVEEASEEEDVDWENF